LIAIGQRAIGVKSNVTNSPALIVPQSAIPVHHDGPCSFPSPAMP
jgi:hypothetical protein